VGQEQTELKPHMGNAWHLGISVWVTNYFYKYRLVFMNYLVKIAGHSQLFQ